MPSEFYITEEQFFAIEAASTESPDNFAAMYDLIYQAVLGLTAVVPVGGSTDVFAAGNVQAWFGAAAEANRGVGAASTFIRNYTQAQIEIRTGQPMTDPEGTIQDASNAIADGIFRDIRQRREVIDGEVYYGIPNGLQIGDIDVTEFSNSLVGDIAAWSGNPLFIGLGIEKFWADNILEDTSNPYDLFAAVTSLKAAGVYASLSEIGSLLLQYANGSPLSGAAAAVGASNDTTTFLYDAYGIGVAFPQLFTAVIKVGSENSDIVQLFEAKETLVHTGGGHDVIYGFSDAVSSADAGGVIDGGAGIDLVSYESASEIAGSGYDVFIREIITDVPFSAYVDLPYGGLNALFNIEILKLGVHDDVLHVDQISTTLTSIDALGNGDFGDTITGHSSTSGITVLLDAGSGGSITTSDGLLEVNNFENVIGSSHDDIITGSNSSDGPSSGANIIAGGDGADVIDGGAGHDLLFSDDLDGVESGSFADILTGGAGDDILIGDSGDGDVLDGGADSDLLISGEGGETLFGGEGNDYIISGGGEDHIYGGSGDDVINALATGSNAIVYFDADSGADFIQQNVDNSGDNGVAEIRFDGLSIDDVTIRWDYKIVTDQEDAFYSEEIVPLSSSGPGTFSVLERNIAGQAYIVVNSTGAVINIGEVTGTFTTLHLVNSEINIGFGYAVDASLENSHILVFSDEETELGKLFDFAWGESDDPLGNLAFADYLYDESTFDRESFDYSGPDIDFDSDVATFPNFYGSSNNSPEDQFWEGFSDPYIGDPSSLSGGTFDPSEVLSVDVITQLSSFETNNDGGINGGSGNDTLEGTDGTDLIYGGAGNDTIYDGDGDDVLFGGADQDRFFAGAGADAYDGGDHHYDEVLYLTSQVGLTIDMTDATNSTGIAAGDTFVDIERIRGSNFDDIIILEGSTAAYDARGGDDLIIDGDGLNTMRGGAGADTFQFGAGDGHQDRIDDFTIGEDTIDISAWGVSQVSDLAIAAHSSGNGTIISYGTDSIRVVQLTVTEASNLDSSSLILAAGNGVTSDGILSGTDADDLMNSTFLDVDGDYITDAGQTIYGGAGRDNIYDGAGDDIVFGGAGQDRFFAGAGADAYDGGAHHYDEVLYSTSTSGLTIDMTDATNSTGIAAGDTFVDIERIRGSNFDDIIILSGGTAAYDARSGDDLIIDGDGLNAMRGGAGADTFQFMAGDGFTDAISDFAIGVDVIDISAWGVGQFADLSLTQHSSGNGVVLTYLDDSIRLSNLTLADAATMTDGDFIFV